MNQSILSLGTKTKGGFTRFSNEDVLQIIESDELPIVPVHPGQSLPVDEVGFIYSGSARWEVDVAPSVEQIDRAKEVLRKIPKAGKKPGSWKRISLSDVKAAAERDPEFEYVTNGAFIVAASKLGWEIEQEEIYGIVKVPRIWWRKFWGY